MFVQLNLRRWLPMSLRSKILVAAGLVALVSGTMPVFAQEIISDVDYLASQPMDDGTFELPFPTMAVLPGGSPGFRVAGACPMDGERGGWFSSTLQGELALTDEQSEKMFALKNSFLDKIGPKFVSIRSTERQLRNLLSEPKLDRAKITELQNKINADQAFIASAKTENKLDAMEVLTSEQRSALRKTMIKGGCGGRGGKMMHMHKRPH
jgi:Spy/CpxP family protein refolding chaperone